MIRDEGFVKIKEGIWSGYHIYTLWRLWWTLVILALALVVSRDFEAVCARLSCEILESEGSVLRFPFTCGT